MHFWFCPHVALWSGLVSHVDKYMVKKYNVELCLLKPSLRLDLMTGLDGIFNEIKYVCQNLHVTSNNIPPFFHSENDREGREKVKICGSQKRHFCHIFSHYFSVKIECVVLSRGGVCEPGTGLGRADTT